MCICGSCRILSFYCLPRWNIFLQAAPGPWYIHTQVSATGILRAGGDARGLRSRSARLAYLDPRCMSQTCIHGGWRMPSSISHQNERQPLTAYLRCGVPERVGELCEHVRDGNAGRGGIAAGLRCRSGSYYCQDGLVEALQHQLTLMALCHRLPGLGDT